MEETVSPEAKPKRKYRPRKPFSGVVVTAGKKKFKCESYKIDQGFLVLKNGRSHTYVSLASCPSFTIVDTRPENVLQFTGTATTMAGSGPVYQGGPPAMQAAIESFSRNRNAELSAMMGPDSAS